MGRTPIHPGEILGQELDALELRATELATRLDVPVERVSDLVEARADLSAEMALRLARYLGTSPEFWLNLQKAYELDLARQRLGDALERLPQHAA